ncbi:hypothetical protein ACVWWJ_003329 [Luteibacter sp. HA06]
MASESTESVAAALNGYAEFYDGLSYGVMSFVPVGTRSILSLDTYLMSSMASTLRGMAALLLMGSVNDAYALARKLYDAALIGTYVNLYLGRNGQAGQPLVEQIDGWITGTKALPRTGHITKYVDGADELNPVRPCLGQLDYEAVRERCNDHTHHNFLSHLLLNDGRVRVKNREQWVAQLGVDTLDIIVLHLAYSFCLSGHYMMSSDYMDAMEMGMTPDYGSQDWVAPTVQAFLRDHVEPRCGGLIAALRAETGMLLEG